MIYRSSTLILRRVDTHQDLSKKIDGWECSNASRAVPRQWSSGSFRRFCPVLLGFSDIFAKVGTPKLGVSRIALLVALIEGPMYFTGFHFWRDTHVIIGIEYGALAAASSIVGMIAYICFFESVLDGQIAIIGTIEAAYPALTVVGALVFLSETLTLMQLAGLAIVICGVVSLSCRRAADSRLVMPKRSLLFPLAALHSGVSGVSPRKLR